MATGVVEARVSADAPDLRFNSIRRAGLDHAGEIAAGNARQRSSLHLPLDVLDSLGFAKTARTRMIAQLLRGCGSSRSHQGKQNLASCLCGEPQVGQILINGASSSRSKTAQRSKRIGDLSRKRLCHAVADYNMVAIGAEASAC